MGSPFVQAHPIGTTRRRAYDTCINVTSSQKNRSFFISPNKVLFRLSAASFGCVCIINPSARPPIHRHRDTLDDVNCACIERIRCNWILTCLVITPYKATVVGCPQQRGKFHMAVLLYCTVEGTPPCQVIDFIDTERALESVPPFKEEMLQAIHIHVREGLRCV